MSSSVSRNTSRPLLSVGIAAVSVTVLGIVITEGLKAADNEIFQRLILAFGESESVVAQLAKAPPPAWTSPDGLANIAGMLILASAASGAWMKLATVPRIFCLISIFVLSLLLQWNLWKMMHLTSHTIGYMSAVFLGALAGNILRMRENDRVERERQYYELKLRNRDMQELQLMLIKEDEKERRLLAGDLHDQVLNDFKQVVSKFDKYVTNPDEATATRIREQFNQIMNEIREVMDNLSPSVLEHLGLGAAIEDCLRRGSDRAGFKVRFKSKVEQTELESLSLVELTLIYRLVQESVTNICKHAEAKTVRATLELEDTTLLIKITDDGKGIDPTKVRADSRGRKYMQWRANVVDGTIGWRSGEDGKGTTVEIRVPVHNRPVAISPAPESEPPTEQAAS